MSNCCPQTPVSHGLATPGNRQGQLGSPCCGRIVRTPEASGRGPTTPPSGPALLQRRIDDEIDAALSCSSAALLSLALCRSHTCSEDHSIFEAVRRHNLRALKFLLQCRPQDVDLHCSGCRPLHLAIQVCAITGDTGYMMAEVLLKHGASANRCDQDNNFIDPPLENAAKRGSLAALALLLSYGADPNVQNSLGLAPLHIIGSTLNVHGAIYGRDLIALLLRHGASPCRADFFGFEPAHYVQHYLDLVQMFAQAKVRWHRRSLWLLRGCSKTKACVGIGWGTLLPELFDIILQFV